MADSEPEVEVAFNEERRMLEMATNDDDLQDDVAAFGFVTMLPSTSRTMKKNLLLLLRTAPEQLRT
jgi:hypothetical protein